MRRTVSIVLLLGALAGCDPPAETSGVSQSSARVDEAQGSSPPPAATPAIVDTRPVVVFLGTSLTAGLGLERVEDTYVARLEELADSAGYPFRAVNAGVSGETSAGGLRRIEWLLEEPLDILVVELGANDGLRGQDPGALADNLREIVRRTVARQPDARVVLVAMEAPPNLGERYTSDFRSVFPTVARAEGAELAPFLLEGVAGVDAMNQDDGIHPTPEGHRRMALNLWPTLEPLLQAREAATP